MVGIYKCNTYEKEKIQKIIDEIFDTYKLNETIKPNMNVCIKPNLLAKKKPNEAVTTHPIIIEVVCSKVISLGANCTIIDSPGGFYTTNFLKSLYTYNELLDIEKTGAKLNYDITSSTVDTGGTTLKRCNILSPIHKADFVINLAKLKTHSMMNLTCAVKNLFGIIPGLDKAKMHARYPDYNEFANMIVDVSNAIQNQFSIVDAIVALEGNGPSAGIPKNMNILTCSESQFELDYVMSKIIGMNEKDAYTVHESIKRNLFDKDNIQIIGESIDDVKSTDYKFPDSLNNQDKINGLKALSIFSKKFIKTYPSFNSKCKLCKRCMELCPNDAIIMDKKKARLKSKSKCIRCFCCHEHCPYKAIDLKLKLDLSKNS